MSVLGSKNPKCWYFDDCPPKTTLTNWILHDTGLTVMTYVVIAACTLACIYVVVKLWKYLHRPYCVDCLQAKKPKRRRTKYTYNVDNDTILPVCEQHWFEHVWNDEPVLDCNVCGEVCEKEWFERYYLIHRCPADDTVIAPSGRFTAIVKKVRGSSSFPSYNAAVFAAGMAAGSSSSSGGNSC